MFVEEQRKKATREFNDITEKLNDPTNNMDERKRADLINETVQLRTFVKEASEYAQHLRDKLDIPSDQGMSESEEYDGEEEYDSEETDGEDSNSDENSRPSKRPRN